MAALGAGADATAALHGRHAHWVLRTTSLRRSVAFYEAVFGMRVLRHEEHGGPCPVTCNGEFETPWSKTMMGYDTEDVSYALELTFNYGITSYRQGAALKDIAMRLRQPLMDVLSAAGALGWGPAQSNGTSTHLVGPDGYRYVLLPDADAEGREAGAASSLEPFDHVRLRVREVQRSVDFYTQFLGMVDLTGVAISRGQPSLGYMDGVRVVGFAAPGSGRSAVPLFLEESESGEPVRVEQWEGRHTIALPAAELRAAYDRIRRELPDWYVVHELKELEEQLGTLLIAVVRDPDGLEVGLVSAEAFDAAARAAADFAAPDWALRRRLAEERGVPEEAEAPRAANRPDWSFEDEIQKHPEAWREVSEQADEMWKEAMRRAEMNKELLESAQQMLDSNDVQAAQAIDWDTIAANQRFVDDWLNRHKPTNPDEVAALESVRIQAGGGLDPQRLRELTARLAAEDAPHEEL